MKKTLAIIASFIALIGIVCLLSIPFSFYIDNPGITAIQLRVGKAPEHNESGLYAKASEYFKNLLSKE